MELSLERERERATNAKDVVKFYIFFVGRLQSCSGLKYGQYEPLEPPY